MSRKSNPLSEDINGAQDQQLSHYDERFLDAVMQGSNEGIVVTNAEGEILKYNQKFLDLLEYSSGNLIGSPLISLFPDIPSLDFDIVNYKIKIPRKN